MWRQRSSKLEPREWDPDHKCLGHWKHTFGRGDCDVDGNDNYDYVGDDNNVELLYTTQRVEKIQDFIHVFNKRKDCPYDLESTIHLSRDMIVLNEVGLNSDHRGSNHLNIEIRWRCLYQSG
jgi:hypothetical protein